MNEAAGYATTNGIDMGDMEEIFKYLDKDSNGVVDRDEFEQKGAQDVTEDMAPSFGDVDLNGDEVLEEEEWSAACECGKAYVDTCGSPEQCKEMFDLADDDTNEVVDEEEFEGGGEECKTADDGNCEFFSAHKTSAVRKISLAKWMRKHFKRSGRNLFALAKIRAQHMKGEFVKLSDLIKKHHLAHRRQHKRNGKARQVQHLRQRGHRGNTRKVQFLRQKVHRGNARRAQHLRHGGRRAYRQQVRNYA